MIVAHWDQPVLDISSMSVANQLDKPATSSLAWSCNLTTQYLQKSVQTSLSPSTNVLPTKLPVLPSLTNNLWSPQECHQITILFASLSSFNHWSFKIKRKLLIRQFSEMLLTMPFQTYLVNAPWASLPYAAPPTPSPSPSPTSASPPHPNLYLVFLFFKLSCF